MKKPILFTIIAAFALAFVVYQSQSGPVQKITGEAYAFTNVNVIPMTSEKVLPDQTVVIKGRTITLVAPSKNVELGDDVIEINGEGKYLIPGLAEMHGHVPPTDPPPNAPRYMNMQYVENTLFLYTAAGITTVRGMLGWPNQLELKDKVRNGELIGPNLYLAGPSFNGNSISSPEEAVQKVTAQKEAGWDLLKIHPGLSREEYDAMAIAANDIGITFGGHIPSDVGLTHAIEMGQETIDHIDGYVAYLNSFDEDERKQKMNEIIQITKEKNVWIVPTQALWETILGSADFDAMQKYDELKYIPKNLVSGYNSWAKRKLESPNTNIEKAKEHASLRRDLLSEMNRNGVKILLGTDAPQLYSVPGFSIHREFQHMKQADMTPYEILVSGTRNVGEYFNGKDTESFGVIQNGKRADLILVNKNPLENISNLKDHSGIMVAGRWMSVADINNRLAMIEESYKEED